MALVRTILGKLILFFDALFSPRSVTRPPAEQARIDASLKNLSLYQFHACPFCVKVRRYMKSRGIAIPLRDAKSELARGELLRGGGKVKVPCLRIDDGTTKWLYESNDIIAFLEKRL
jgi:glutaredoxin